jgi:hypothetical protein
MDSLRFSDWHAWLDVAAMVFLLYALAYGFHHYVALNSPVSSQASV